MSDMRNNGVRLEGVRSMAESCYVTDVEDDGIRLAADDCAAVNCLIDTDSGAATSVGVRVRDAQRCQVTACESRGVNQGFKVDTVSVDSNDTILTGNLAEGCIDDGFVITGNGAGHVLTGNRAVGNGGNGFSGTAGATDVTVVGNIATGNTGYGIETLNACNRWNVSANVFRTNTAGSVALVGAGNVTDGTNLT
jgi:hypothetical protein